MSATSLEGVQMKNYNQRVREQRHRVPRTFSTPLLTFDIAYARVRHHGEPIFILFRFWDGL